MKNILVIGGGAMGSAFTIPCIDNKNKVTITEPYSKLFIKNLSFYFIGSPEISSFSIKLYSFFTIYNIRLFSFIDL